MIKQKITALAVAISLTFATMAPVAFPNVAKAQTREDASIIIKFCERAHRAFMRGDEGAFLRKGMAGLESDANRAVVALACAAYGEGFRIGTRSLV